MADDGKPTGMVMLDEAPPFPEPASPADGEPEGTTPTPGSDTDFIMDTLFGEQPPVPAATSKSGDGQGKGSTPPDGQSPGTTPAPSTAAPAATGGEGSPQPGPSPTGSTLSDIHPTLTNCQN